MNTDKHFGIVINHPAFGRVRSKAEFDGRYVTFGDGPTDIKLDIGKAIERDMESFRKMNDGLKPTDKDFIDISTMELFDVNIDGRFVSIRYVFNENWYNGEKFGGRCAQGDLRMWHQSYEDKYVYNVTRPVMGVDAKVAW